MENQEYPVGNNITFLDAKRYDFVIEKDLADKIKEIKAKIKESCTLKEGQTISIYAFIENDAVCFTASISTPD